MKKYLMSGIAALAFGSLFTSCSHDIDSTGTVEEKVQKTYEEAFLTRFGQPAPTQDWGFGSTHASTRSENANANEWADPAKAYGGLKVPPKLTPEQVAVVKKYFQTHPNLGYKDPQWTNYFIQQVYKGHTSVPEGCATPEAYMAANGTTYLIASDYMDHLAAIDPNKADPETGLTPFVDHINNFNHGDCGENDHVLDNGGNANDGPFHEDKIMYMQNSTTKSFGYFNSNGSVCHTNYTALVSYKKIMEDMGAEANCLNDGWDRSFMGFDFEQMIDDQCYATKWVDGKEVAKYFVINEYYAEYYINGEKTSNYTYMYNNNPVRMLSDQMNRYCADVVNVDDSQLYSDYRVNGEYLGKQLNTDFIDDLLSQGYLPVDNKSLRVWAKVGGCADGYFSDWIVTLTEAKTENQKADLMIIAEDLSVGDGDEDFDFNDVVFEVYYGDAGKAKARILAAGGILELKVDGKEVHNEFSKANDNIDCAGKMINTNGTNSADANVHSKSLDGLTAPVILLSKEVKTPAQARDNIIIEVYKNNQWIELDAVIGKVASKVRVGTDYTWKNEREYVGDNFKDFVSGQAGYSDWYKQ